MLTYNHEMVQESTAACRNQCQTKVSFLILHPVAVPPIKIPGSIRSGLAGSLAPS
jgi:hypothetical protein